MACSPFSEFAVPCVSVPPLFSAMNHARSMKLEERIEAIVEAARDWREPEHAPRVEAVQRSLAAPNRFTEEALAFCINAAMHRLSPAALRSWWGGRHLPERSVVVGVRPGGTTPLAGLRAVLAAHLAGHRCLFLPSDRSPALVPAFAAALHQSGRDTSLETVRDEQQLVDRVEAVVGEGAAEEKAAFERHCEAAGLSAQRRHWRSDTYSVAVLDGEEDPEARERLAEDAFLLEGLGPQSVRLLWAPEGMEPDPYLEAMAHFRAFFPAHADTPGALQMQQAFLEARGQSHAYGEGLEFLLSRGAPGAQAPGHLRWSEYDDLEEVCSWLTAHASEVHAVVARPALSEKLPLPVLAPGTVHRQYLEGPGSREALSFIASL